MNQAQEVGYVISIRNSLVHIDGLPSIHINDIVENESGVRGVVTALDENNVEVLVVDEGQIIPGQLFKASKSRLTLKVGTFLLGRAVNPLGTPIDGRGV